MTMLDDCACADMGHDVCPACERAIARAEADRHYDERQATGRDADRYEAQYGWGPQ